jgi:hypothetical protein
VTEDGRVVWQRATTAWNGRAIKYPRDFAAGAAERGARRPVRSLHCGSPARAGRESVVRYELDRDCCVSLRVFDAAGRVAQTLFEGERAAGRYEASFAVPGQALPGGVYFVQLTARAANGAGQAEGRKLVLAD